MGEQGQDIGIPGFSRAELVGRGGSGIVYRAFQEELDRWVAVKVIPTFGDVGVQRRFERERRAMGRLSDVDGVLSVYQAGVTDTGDLYLVMPFMSDGSLKDLMSERGAVGWQQATEMVEQVADAIEQAHQVDVVHCDLKPGNILLSSSGRPLVADFGIARLGLETTSATSTGLTLTPAFSPPEAFDGASGVSVSGDVYSLGATLWALIAGRPPFTETSGAASLSQIVGRLLSQPVGDLRSFAPAPICEVIEWSMQKEPADRPASAAAFASALREARAKALALHTGGTPVVPPVIPAVPAAPAARPPAAAPEPPTEAAPPGPPSLFAPSEQAQTPAEPAAVAGASADSVASGLTTPMAVPHPATPHVGESPTVAMASQDDDGRRRGLLLAVAAAALVLLGGIAAAVAIGGGDEGVSVAGAEGADDDEVLGESEERSASQSSVDGEASAGQDDSDGAADGSAAGADDSDADDGAAGSGDDASPMLVFDFPTPTPDPAATPTPTPRPSATPAPTPTLRPGETPRPTSTPRPTATPRATARPTSTPRATATPRPTSTPRPTATPVPAPLARPALRVVSVTQTTAHINFYSSECVTAAWSWSATDGSGGNSIASAGYPDANVQCWNDNNLRLGDWAPSVLPGRTYSLSVTIRDRQGRSASASTSFTTASPPATATPVPTATPAPEPTATPEPDPDPPEEAAE